MHSFVHIELPVLELERAKEFYGGLFGWQFQSYFGDGYMLFSTGDGQLGGGLSVVDAIPEIRGFHNYVEVADIEATLAQAAKLGGKLITSKTELPGGMGFYAVLQSPDGYNLGIWQMGTAA